MRKYNRFIGQWFLYTIFILFWIAFSTLLFAQEVERSFFSDLQSVHQRPKKSFILKRAFYWLIYLSPHGTYDPDWNVNDPQTEDIHKQKAIDESLLLIHLSQAQIEKQITSMFINKDPRAKDLLSQAIQIQEQVLIRLQTDARVKILSQFERTTPNSLPESQKAAKKLGSAMLTILEELQGNNNQEARDQKLQQALHVYQSAILTSYRAKWTPRTLRKYIFEQIDSSRWGIRPSDAAGASAGLMTVAILRTSAAQTAVGVGLAALVHPIAGLAAPYATKKIADILETPKGKIALGIFAGLLTKYYLRELSLLDWKSENPNPILPTNLVLEYFWMPIAEHHPDLPSQNQPEARLQWLIERLEGTRKGSICEAFLGLPTERP